MRAVSTFLAAIAVSTVSAQNFLDFSPGQLPACAQSCTQLTQAQNGCLPTVSDNPTSCFCQSALLTGLKQNANAVCSDVCTSASDRQLIQTWYINYCQNGGSATYKASGQQTAAPTAATAAAAPAAATASPTDAAASGASPTAASTASDLGNNYVDTTGKSWWDLHGRWIIMVIVLVVGFAIIIAGGIWWKKRYEAKRDRSSGGLPTAWGPSQHQHPAAFAVADGTQEKGGASARPSQSRNISNRSSEPDFAKDEPIRNFSRPGKRLSKIVGRN